jgi:hypothetical protein
MLAPLTKPGQKAQEAVIPPEFAVPPVTPPEAAATPARKSARKRHKSKPAAHPPTVADAPLNPTAWWNTLQDQFTKIAATAAAAGAAPPTTKAGKAAKGATAKRARTAAKTD